MRQVIYVSTATRTFDAGSVRELGEASAARNKAAGLSGVLLYDGLRFLQLLEGPEIAVGIALKRIERDPRHRSLVILSDREVPAPSFPAWAMVGRTLPGTDLLSELAPLMRDAPASTRALFESFARIRSAA